MKTSKQEQKRFVNEFFKESRIEAKLGYCVYCNTETTSFCNSHTIPSFILKNIQDNGLLFNFYHLVKIDFQKHESGVNEAGTFYLICRDCDAKIFKDYEEEKFLLKEPSNLIMAEIALKNILVYWYKRNNEIKLYEKLQEKYPQSNYVDALKQKNKINKNDIGDIKNDFIRTKKIIEGKKKGEFHLMFWVKCEYIVPLAFQGSLALYGDLEGRLINRIYDNDPKVRLQYINVCVFPLESSSVIMLFYYEPDKNYKTFERQFNKLDLDEKLRLVSFLIINYSESFYISKKASEEIFNNKKVMRTARNSFELKAETMQEVELMERAKLSELRNFEDFPNLLSKNMQIIF